MNKETQMGNWKKNKKKCYCSLKGIEFITIIITADFFKALNELNIKLILNM